MERLTRFDSYALELEKFAAEMLAGGRITPVGTERIKLALDGESAATLRAVVPAGTRSQLGAYFTPTLLAEQALNFFKQPISNEAIFLDSACGAGDLLLSAARRLPVRTNLIETLSLWGERLIGFDIQPEFVRVAKTRLLLQAIQRSEYCHAHVPPPHQLFSLILTTDATDRIADFSRPSHIVINPSFTREQSPPNCEWATDKVSSAAIMLDTCVSNARAGTEIVAILPDVLRSGSNYRRWRRHINSKAALEKILVIGKFDTWTEVDVFLLRLKVRPNEIQAVPSDWWEDLPHEGLSVGDMFDVKVGQVVPHRDPEKGGWFPYVHPNVVPQWSIIREFARHRRFLGNVFQPPFVVVRRTSRPRDRYRAVGTIICGRRAVAVENHLVVLTPKDGRVRTCKKLLEVLKAQTTNDWLNERIRCRHLTVPAIQQIPWRS